MQVFALVKKAIRLIMKANLQSILAALEAFSVRSLTGHIGAQGADVIVLKKIFAVKPSSFETFI